MCLFFFFSIYFGLSILSSCLGHTVYLVENLKSWGWGLKRKKGENCIENG